MDSPETTRLIFQRAIRHTKDAKFVSVRVEQLVAAIGKPAAVKLVGRPLDIEAAQRSRDAKRAEIMSALHRERDELRAISKAGGGDSRRELQAIEEKIAKCERGQLDVFTTVDVNVGKFKAAIDEAIKADSGLADADPVVEIITEDE